MNNEFTLCHSVDGKFKIYRYDGWLYVHNEGAFTLRFLNTFDLKDAINKAESHGLPEMGFTVPWETIKENLKNGIDKKAQKEMLAQLKEIYPGSNDKSLRFSLSSGLMKFIEVFRDVFKMPFIEYLEDQYFKRYAVKKIFKRWQQNVEATNG